jgi:hypothetical protein
MTKTKTICPNQKINPVKKKMNNHVSKNDQNQNNLSKPKFQSC